MSFRGRLWLFFALIVIVPMIALAIVLFSLTANSETGKADAEIAQGVRTAFAVHNAETRRVRDEARRVAADPALRRSVVENRIADARTRIGELSAGMSRRSRSAHRPAGLGRTGPSSAVAPQGATIEREDGQPVAIVRVFGTRASELDNRISRSPASRGRSSAALACSTPRSAVPPRAQARRAQRAGCGRVRGRRRVPAASSGSRSPAVPTLEIAVFEPAARSRNGIRNRFLIAALLVFLVAALAAAR